MPRRPQGDHSRAGSFEGIGNGAANEGRAANPLDPEKDNTELEEFYRSIIENMLDAVIIVDWDGCILFANQAAVKLAEMNSPDDAQGLNAFDFIHDRSREELLQHLALVRENLPGALREYRIRTAKGKNRWIEAIGKKIQYNDRFADLVTFREVTRRKEAEEALKESEEKYRVLIDNAHDVIGIFQEGKNKVVNRIAQMLSGYPENELLSFPVEKFIHPGDRETALATFKKIQSAEAFSAMFDIRVLTKGGETLWLSLSAIAIVWEGRPAVLYFGRDITKEKKLENQFLAAQKMEAVGTLAMGVAHNFNNLLTGITGLSSLVLSSLSPGNPHFGHLEKIQELVASGSGLTKRLLAYAQKGKSEAKPIDLNQIVWRTSSLFQETRKNIKVHFHYQEDLWTMEADPSQMEQVLLNLFINAWQAMPGGGNLILDTQNVSLDEPYVTPFQAKPGRYVKLTVTDTGVGMGQETRERVFEPFFTTKGMEGGTGLGLASVYGIVRNHGGFINVYSAEGRGSTFILHFPPVDKEIVRNAEATATKMVPGTGTILLVDDEQLIRESIGKALSFFGYKVLTAEDGQKAIDIYRANQGEIKVVILDMVMAGMNGEKVFGCLKEIDPAVKVILSSGYGLGDDLSKIMARRCNAFVPKPFDVKELSQTVREVLVGH